MRTMLWLAGGLMAIACAAHAETPIWYIGHFGPDVCVPVDDIGDDAQRLYYGGGHMHTPEQFQYALRAGGIVLTRAAMGRIPETVFVAYHDAGSGADERWYEFFTDLGWCRDFMAHQEARR